MGSLVRYNTIFSLSCSKKIVEAGLFCQKCGAAVSHNGEKINNENNGATPQQETTREKYPAYHMVLGLQS